MWRYRRLRCFWWQRHLIVILGKFRISGIGKEISNRLNVALQNQPTRHWRNPVTTLRVRRPTDIK
jgi:hypothetical protein